jgi:hypothetical protein
VTKDVADDDLAPHGLRLRDDLLGLGDGDGQGLLDEDMAAGVQRGDGVFGVRVGIAGDRDRVGLGRLERGMEIAVFGITAAEFGVQLGAGIRGAGDQADDLETGQLMISQGVRTAHVTGADAEDSDGGLAHTPSITLPFSASSRDHAARRNYSSD